VRFAFEAVAERLRSRITAGVLPGHDAHLTMAPSNRLDRWMLSVEGKQGREAAVLVLVHPDEHGAACVVLTARPDGMRDHAGQVAFPGGRRETGETFADAALREAHEEVGLDAQDAELVGPMTPLYIPPTRFLCHPFVALADVQPALVPGEAEVAAILHVPLDDLFAPEALAFGTWEVNGQPSAQVPYYRVGAYRVWGATAMMLAELRAML